MGDIQRDVAIIARKLGMFVIYIRVVNRQTVYQTTDISKQDYIQKYSAYNITSSSDCP